MINVGWFSKMIFPNFNFRVNLHGTVGYASTDRWAPRNMYLHAAKEVTRNVCRKIVGRKLNCLSYTYYYASYYNVLSRFLKAIEKGESVPILPEQQLETAKIIDCVYRSNGVSKWPM